ncbi:uncharacterized protein [Periplaneta americana]|uniref:uncharacterized protein n=1 Tax=Periplaneta americana TaxID=6978 RepID=UPI0037E94AF7
MFRTYIRLPHFLGYVATLVISILILWMIVFPIGFPNVFSSTKSTLPQPLRHTKFNIHPSVKQIAFLKTNSIFEGFNNVTGTANGELIVPNILHYVRIRRKSFSFIEAVCILSAFKNHKPDMIMFHTDMTEFTGPYWEKIKNTPGFSYKINKIKVPRHIFGKQISRQYFLLHATEFMKIKTLMDFGGIVLDSDIYVVKSLKGFRKYEMAIGWENGACISTRVLIAHKEARFLKLWLQSFRQYYPSKWYYNAGCKPTWEILTARPELVHRVRILFGLRSLARYLYRKWNWSGWKKLYTIPVLVRHSSLRPVRFKWLPKFDEKTIKYYPLAFGVMVRDVYTFT